MALLTADEIIEIAVQIEENGEAFYSAAAETASTDEIKSLFEDLAVQERYHLRTFQELGRGVVELALAPDQWDEFQAYTRALLEQSFFSKEEGALSQAAQARDEVEALRAALEFEKETLLFFQRLYDAVRGPGKQKVDQIMQEERQHIRRLSAMLAPA